MKKNFKKQIKKVIKRKGNKLYVKWKGYDSSFNSWIDKGGRVKAELDLSNYTTKPDLKNAAGVDTSKFAKKVDLANLRFYVDKLDIHKLKNVLTDSSNLESKVDKLDVDKLVPVSVDLSKLSDVVKNDVLKKDVCNAKIKSIEDEIPDITKLATNASLNANINEVNDEILNITNLATITALTAVENKIPNVSNFVKKLISEIENKIATDHNHDKYITTQEFNKLTSESFTAKLKQANLASKRDIASFVKRQILIIN